MSVEAHLARLIRYGHHDASAARRHTILFSRVAGRLRGTAGPLGMNHPPQHGHCPCACEHPQPIVANGDRLPHGAVAGVEYCGCCWVQGGQLCPMVPCTPTTCATS